MTRSMIAVAVGLAYAALALPASAQALDCPTPQAAAHPGVLQESPAQVAATGSRLASGDSGNRAREVVADLRKKYPHVSDAELENYLVTAYCPAAARLDGLSVAARRGRVEQFAQQASVAVHGN